MRSPSLIESADTPFHRTILMTLYATGVRRSELAHLKLTDIDSGRMVIHIHEGKGGKDRDIMLSPNLLTELRDHYRRLPRKPAEWLFPAGHGIRPTAPSPTKSSGGPAAKPPNAPISRNPYIPTPYDIASPPTCLRTAQTCEPFKCCWVTATLKRPRFIFTFQSATSMRLPARWMRCRFSAAVVSPPGPSRCLRHPWRWLTLSAPLERVSSRAARSGLPGNI